MRNTRILGCSVTDLFVHVSSMPKGNEEQEFAEPSMRSAGSAWICANLFQSLHLPYSLYTVHGTGLYGDALSESSREYGLMEGQVKEAVQGCTYTMIDAQGNTSTMLVPGCEYSCPEVPKESVDDREYCFFGGEGLAFEDKDAWIQAVRPYDGRILFRPTQTGVLTDLLHMDEILALKPILHLSDEEALSFARDPQGDLFSIVQRIQKEKGCSVLLALKDSSCLFLDGVHSIFVPAVEKFECSDPSGAFDAHAASFLAAKVCGLPDQRAMEFAQNVFVRICGRDTTVLSDPALEQCREMLTGYLTEGSYRGKA